MRVLFLTAELPYPADSGGRIKTLSLLEHLRLRHHVETLAFRRRYLSDEQAVWCAETAVTTVSLNRARSPGNLARSYLARQPLSVERNASREMAALVAQRLTAGPWDAVFVDGWLMGQYLNGPFNGLRLLHEHNAEHILWERQAALERSPLRRWLARREAGRVRRYEARLVKQFDFVFAVSEADRDTLITLGADAVRVLLLPNLPDPALLSRPDLRFDEADTTILYFGTLSWQPNIEGLERFLRDIFPEVRRHMPEARFVLAGRECPDWLERLAAATEGVEFLGAVDDPEPLYRRARVFVEATRSGGGTKLKVLNALARGLPVVCSRQAAEGIDAVAGTHLVIADARFMAGEIVRLLTNVTEWRALSENGRALIRARYLARTAYRALDEVLGDAPQEA